MREEARARLLALRGRVDALDDAALALVAERAALVAEIAALKAAEGVPLKDEAREQAIVERLKARRPPGLTEAATEAVARAVLAACYPAQDGPEHP